MVRDCVGVTLLLEDEVAEVRHFSLTASGIVPTTEGVGVPRYDLTMGMCRAHTSAGKTRQREKAVEMRIRLEMAPK
jgi:hypothetical protein